METLPGRCLPHQDDVIPFFPVRPAYQPLAEPCAIHFCVLQSALIPKPPGCSCSREFTYCYPRACGFSPRDPHATLTYFPSSPEKTWVSFESQFPFSAEPFCKFGRLLSSRICVFISGSLLNIDIDSPNLNQRVHFLRRLSSIVNMYRGTNTRGARRGGRGGSRGGRGGNRGGYRNDSRNLTSVANRPDTSTFNGPGRSKAGLMGGWYVPRPSPH